MRWSGSTRYLSIDEYRDLCRGADVSPAYHPDITEFYFSRMHTKPVIVGRYDCCGKLLAAYPVLYHQLFPNPIHRRLLGRKFAELGDIGQPEALFPVAASSKSLALHCLSPVTSRLLKGAVRGLGGWSLKAMAIVKTTAHRRDTAKLKAFLGRGGLVHFSADMPKSEFADIYVRLHNQRWPRRELELRSVANQITSVYEHVHGVVLFEHAEPVAAKFCLQAEGRSIYYVDFVNLGIVATAEAKENSYGSLLLLASVRKAEEMARERGKTLRYSFGYDYGPTNYKSRWTNPEPTFVGI